MGKSVFRSVPLEETILSGALVLRCTLKEFGDVKSYITHFTRAKIVYQAISADKLFISRGNGREPAQD